MARPIKQGLDYFSLDTDFDADPKIEYLEALHGLSGLSIFIKLCARIYRNGYFLQWDKRDTLIFSKKINVDINTVNAVINSCIDEGLFSKKIFDEFGLLTSKRIQKQYIRGTERRNKTVMHKPILLINPEEEKSKEKQDIYIMSTLTGINAHNNSDNPEEEKKEKQDIFIMSTLTGINAHNNSDNDNNNGIDVDISTQRKGKERKGKERDKASSVFADYNLVLSLYLETLPKLNSEKIITTEHMELIDRVIEVKPEYTCLTKWKEYFQLVSESPFLMGEVKAFKASFSWLVHPANLNKVLTMQYHDKRNFNNNDLLGEVNYI